MSRYADDSIASHARAPEWADDEYVCLECRQDFALLRPEDTEACPGCGSTRIESLVSTCEGIASGRS